MSNLQDALDALAHAPDEIEKLRAVCIALIEEKRDDELLPYADRALAIEPRDVHFVNWRAYALTLMGRHFDAVATWRNHAALAWRSAYYEMSLGQSLVVSGDAERGIPMLEHAWRTAAAEGEWFARQAEHLYGEALLRTARPAGFEPWLARNHSDTGNYRPADIPSWSGEHDLRGKRVLITHQMGYGDQFLLFANVAQWQAAGAQLMITCDPPLHALLQASLPECVVVGAPRPLHQQESLPEALADAVRKFAPDLHATLLHLPLLAARQTPLPSPFFPAYLRAPDAERAAAAEWAREMRAAHPGKSLIGIFWD
ncbi:TPR repeat protein (fragment) [Paraburkholderia piptadeniae]|uniref:TPR repeat protein n=1 Tax=Paraburkholderia piptadeniae TaxID=1701573 RepID=A0A1N7RZT9_9BURK